MAFPPAETRVPSGIGAVYHVFIDKPNAPIRVRFVFEVLDQNGCVMAMRQGDELPHMSPGQISAGEAFLAQQRAKAEATLPQ